MSCALSCDAKPLSMEQRIEAVDEVLGFSEVRFTSPPATTTCHDHSSGLPPTHL